MSRPLVSLGQWPRLALPPFIHLHHHQPALPDTAERKNGQFWRAAGGERCPTVRQDTPLRARLLERYHLRQADKREGNLWRFWIFNERLMRSTDWSCVPNDTLHTYTVHYALYELLSVVGHLGNVSLIQCQLWVATSLFLYVSKASVECMKRPTFHIPTFQEVHFFLLHYLHYTMAQYRA